MLFLYGATGFVGKRIAKKLAYKTELIISGRNEKKLKQLSQEIYTHTGQRPKVFCLNIHHIYEDLHLRKLGVKAVLNLAYLPSVYVEKLIAYSVNNKVNYIDIDERTKVIIEVWKKYYNISKLSRVSVIQSAGFLSSVEEVLVHELIDVKRINLFYDSLFIMSPGSMKSLMYLISSSPTYTDPKSVFWRNGEWKTESLNFRSFQGKLYVSLDTPAVATIPRILKNLDEFRTYLHIPKFLKPFFGILISLNKPLLRNRFSALIRKFINTDSLKGQKKDKVILKIHSYGSHGSNISFWKFFDPIEINEKIILFCIDKIFNDDLPKGVIPPTVAFPDLRTFIRNIALPSI